MGFLRCSTALSGSHVSSYNRASINAPQVSHGTATWTAPATEASIDLEMSQKYVVEPARLILREECYDPRFASKPNNLNHFRQSNERSACFSTGTAFIFRFLSGCLAMLTGRPSASASITQVGVATTDPSRWSVKKIGRLFCLDCSDFF